MTATDVPADLTGELPEKRTTISFFDALAYCWRYWRRYPLGLATMVVLGAAGPVLNDVIGPIFIGRMTDALTVDDTPTLTEPLLWLLAAVACAAGFVVLRFAGEAIGGRLFTAVMQRSVQDGFHAVQGYATDWHANTFAGSTVRSLTRGMWSLDQFADVLYFSMLPLLVVMIGVAVALTISFPLVGLVAIGFMIVFGGISIWTTGYWAKPALDRANAADTTIGGALADAIGGNAAVKAFAAEAREEARFRQTMGRWRGLANTAWLRMVAITAIQGALWVAFRIGIMGLAIWLWWIGDATPGDVVYIMINHFIISGYIREVGQHIRNLQQAVSEMEDLVVFSRQIAGVSDRPGAEPLQAARGEIGFDRVTFRYSGQSKATYNDFSLTLRPGEKVALVGPSGSGKSTFVKLVQRLYDLEGGQITIDGQDIAAVTQASLRQAIALVPQEPALFHRSLAENIAYGRPGVGHDAVVDAARRAHADGFIERLPNGYATLVGERGVKLSGGERQRVAIARAIVADAPILILDEATSALDSESEALIQDALADLMRGRTAIIIAHRLSTIRHVDRILVFDNGRVVEDGPHKTLIANPDGHYRRLYEIQAGGFLMAGE